MSVAETTRLTAMWGAGMLTAIVLTGWLLWRGHPALRMLGGASLLGVVGFATISLANSPDRVGQFLAGVALIGMGRGMLIVGGLALVMGLCDRTHAGLFLALWGITQALSQGVGTIAAGLARDVIGRLSGEVASGYIAVYLSALLLIAIAGVLLLILRLRGQLRAEQVRSPWSSLEQVNADQIIF